MVNTNKNCSFIILSAGAPHYGESPASLKTTNKELTVLDWQLRSLEDICDKKLIVTGYNSSQFKKKEFHSVQFIENKKWEDTSSSYSFLLALESIKGSVITSYGDLLFRKKIPIKYLKSKKVLCSYYHFLSNHLMTLLYYLA